MKRKLSVLTLMVLMTLVIGASGATAQGTAAPVDLPSTAASLGTEFTYQGYLTDGGSPANGTFDFKFKLYDDPDFGEGTLLDKVLVGNQPVADGLFTVELDFGDVFGTALYLEVGVRTGSSSGAYTTLSPRQALTPTPYAIYAMSAPWSGLDGVPAGFADGTDNNTTYTAGLGLDLIGTEFSAQGSPYDNVVVVAKSGGDYTSVQSALDSIADAAAGNPYIVWVAPGVYTETVTMKAWVDIEGAGELVTKITTTGSPSDNTGTVVGVDNAELRFLTVENTGGEDYAIAIYNNGQSPRLTHVTATASGGTIINYSVYNFSSSSPQMTNVTATASGGALSYGVVNYSSSPQMTNVTATASGGYYNYGVLNNSSSSPRLTHVTATVSGGAYSAGVYNKSSSPQMTDVIASASGGTERNCGVRNDSSSPQMTDVTATASGGTNSFGVFNIESSSPTINNSIIEASGGTNNYGIYNVASSGNYTVTVNNSQITGSTATIYSDAFFTTYVGASLLAGGGVFPNIGKETCAGVYDESYSFSASSCP